MDRLVRQHPVVALSSRAPGLLGECFEVVSVGEQEVRVDQRSESQRQPGRTEPPLETLEVVEVLGERALLPAMLSQNGQEVLVDFGERRRGICRLVHVEAPGASADLV